MKNYKKGKNIALQQGNTPHPLRKEKDMQEYFIHYNTLILLSQRPTKILHIYSTSEFRMAYSRCYPHNNPVGSSGLRHSDWLKITQCTSVRPWTCSPSTILITMLFVLVLRIIIIIASCLKNPRLKVVVQKSLKVIKNRGRSSSA